MRYFYFHSVKEINILFSEFSKLLNQNSKMLFKRSHHLFIRSIPVSIKYTFQIFDIVDDMLL